MSFETFESTRFRAKSLALIEQANSIISEYQAQGLGLGRNFACTFANDIEPKKGRSHVANCGERGLVVGDVAHLKPADLPGVADLAWASPPCQDVSLAGDRVGLKLITLKAGAGVKAAGRAKALRKPAGAPAAPKKPPVRPLGPSDVAKARRVAQTEALAWLAETYSAAFGSVVKPLALAAGRLVWPEAKRRGIKRRALNAALKRHTGSLPYLDALAADGAMRFGLDGQPMGPVSAEHRAGAIEATTKNACNQRSAASDA